MRMYTYIYVYVYLPIPISTYFSKFALSKRVFSGKCRHTNIGTYILRMGKHFRMLPPTPNQKLNTADTKFPFSENRALGFRVSGLWKVTP